LLVFKAKPDAVKEDVDPDVQKSLAAHSELITTDRLLDLIDQFAGAEGRMKWAPNKKLHFEVAIIKAIQSLGQATLDEVIEKLGQLRDGKSVLAEKKTQRAENIVAAVPAAPKKNVTDTAASRELRVAEATNDETDVDKIWENVFARIPTTKAFVRNSAVVAHVLPSEGRHFVLGFSPDQKSPMDILGTATNRKLIESLLHEVSGKDWTLKLTLRDDLIPKSKPSTTHAPEDYADDPLIREALDIFKGQIKS